MNSALKKLAAYLPRSIQQDLKRLHFKRQISKGRFSAGELEFEQLDRWVKPGDWVIDVGANIGHYTLKMSSLAGPEGRVIAFEPVPGTFELLSANCARSPLQNITLFNAAASDAIAIQGIDIPTFDTGLDNYYMAHLTSGTSSLKVFCLPVDTLDPPHRISLVKIDAEGHDFNVIKGMRKLLEKDHPVLIVEELSDELTTYLDELGYEQERITGSHNTIFKTHREH